MKRRLPIALCGGIALTLALLGGTGTPTEEGRAHADETARPDNTPGPIGPGSLASREREPPTCKQPRVAITRSKECGTTSSYPACRWHLPEPDEAQYAYSFWRNTADDHRWGRPALVSLVLAAATEYAEEYPGEHVSVGDLDAPGPRHETHDRGVDVDLYLPGMMAAENEGGGVYTENYEGKMGLYVRSMRSRVQALAQILASCTSGRLRIFYNDEDVSRRFNQWFSNTGLSSPFGRPMKRHNDLHRFHFHVTIDHTLPVLPSGD